MRTSSRRRGTGSGRSCDEAVNCHICSQPSIGQCQSCWKFYCKEHGDTVCAACESAPPTSGAGWVGYSRGGSETEYPPSLNTFQRRVKILESLGIGQDELALLNVDLFNEGFLLRWVCWAPYRRRRFLGRFPEMPEFEFEAQDDLGNDYKGWSAGGGGSETETNGAVLFRPAIPKEATKLRIRIKKAWVGVFGSIMRPKAMPTATGWHFEIPLA
jgi:hypothetical protein